MSFQSVSIVSNVGSISLNSGIDKYFQTITNSEMAGVKKPNPKIFEYALSKANVEKNKVIINIHVNSNVCFNLTM